MDAVEIGCDGKIAIWWSLSDIRHTGTCVSMCVRLLRLDLVSDDTAAGSP